MYIQLYQIKKHLNIDEDFHDDDEYLMSLEEVAERVVETNIDTKLAKLENGDGEIPSAPGLGKVLCRSPRQNTAEDAFRRQATSRRAARQVASPRRRGRAQGDGPRRAGNSDRGRQRFSRPRRPIQARGRAEA